MANTTGTLEEAVYRRQIYKQQQANMIVDAQQEPRYWEGVQVRRIVWEEGRRDLGVTACSRQGVDCCPEGVSTAGATLQSTTRHT